MPRSPNIRVSLAFVALALGLLPLADLELTTLAPSGEIVEMLGGLFRMTLLDIGTLLTALAHTIAFAMIGVSLGAVAGFGLAILFSHRLVRWGCAATRSVHELFWALIFLQFLGLHPLAGVLALALPYGATFAKVFAEIMEEADPSPLAALPSNTSTINSFFFVLLPESWPHMMQYTAYRLECGLRSSAVLGFIGLPTLGYHLESYFSQRLYGEAWTLMLLFYLIIATLRYWARPGLIPVYLAGSVWLLWSDVAISLDNLMRFLTVDIVPAPLLQSSGHTTLVDWAGNLAWNQALPGGISTLILTQIALVATGVLTLLLFPLVSQRLAGSVGSRLGHLILVVLRSTPEYVLAYIFLIWWGPSMLPAIVALAIHNGAIIGHLIGRRADTLVSRADAPSGLNLYGFEMVPRLYGQFLAFLFYRWEIIMRETAILGMLGIHTLGFHIDSAIQDIRLDRAMVLIGFTALLNIGVDSLSRRLRKGLRLSVKATAV